MNPNIQLAEGVEIGGSYRIIRLLGEGGMGAVWEASHLRLADKRVAIKVLHAEFMDRDSTARFQREAEIASKLNHPNIVRVHDYNVLPNGNPYIVMDRLEGRDLATHIETEGALAWFEAKDILAQVCSALSAAHTQGIVHRDLKPENIFLETSAHGGDAVVKVLDFGISKVLNSNTVKTQASTVLGTPHYMAPEQAAGKIDAIDARSDIFALGAILFEMVTGKMAFTGDTILEVIFKISFGDLPEFQLPANTPSVVRDVIERATSKSPAERFASVETMLAATQDRTDGGAAFRETTPSLAPIKKPSQPSPASAPSPKSNKGPLVLALGVLGVCLAAIALLIAFSQRPSKVAEQAPALDIPAPIQQVVEQDSASENSAPVKQTTTARRKKPGRKSTSAVEAPEPEPATIPAAAHPGIAEKSGKNAAPRKPLPSDPASAEELDDASKRAIERVMTAFNSQQWRQTTNAANIAKRVLKSNNVSIPTQLFEAQAIAFCHLDDVNHAKQALRKLPAKRRAYVKRTCSFPTTGYSW